MLHREIWDLSGGYLSTDLKMAADFELWCRFYSKTILYGTDSPLGGFRYQYKQKSRQKEEYARESESALTLMRKSMNWRPGAWGTKLLAPKMRKLPGINKLLETSLGYDAHKITREKSDQPDGYWRVTPYRF